MRREASRECKVRLAMVGCGAVAERCHLPAARVTPEVEIVALVDKDISRAGILGERFGVGDCTDDYRQVLKNVDGVIVGVPNYLHAPVSIEFLKRGIAVLVEKPMALTVEEAETMVKTGDTNGVALQVGLMCRFFNGSRIVKQAIEEDWLGKLQSFSVEWGIVYDWPATSGSFSSKEQAGGGVLVDFGSHILDLLLWWIGDAGHVEYRDDSLGGVEADCWLSLLLEGPTGPVQGTVTLSRLRKLGQAARIVGERSTIEFHFSPPTIVRMWPSTSDGKDLLFVMDSSSLPRQSWRDLFAEQLRSFAQTILTGGKSVVPGESVLGSVALIERCYRDRQPLELPWMRPIVSTQRKSA